MSLVWLNWKRRGEIPGSPVLDANTLPLDKPDKMISTMIINNSQPCAAISRPLVHAVRRGVHCFLETMDLLSDKLSDSLLLVYVVF